MKRLSVIFLLALTFASCTKDTDITAGLETYRELYVSESGETEVPYESPEETCHVDGIVSADFTISGGKYYFETRRDNVGMIAYCDLATGNTGIVCPDPLCSHGKDVCRYANFNEFCITDEEGVFYASRVTMSTAVYRVDLNNDTVTEVCRMSKPDAGILGYDNGRVYIVQHEYGLEGHMAGLAYRISYIDTATNEITDLGYIPDETAMFLNVMQFVHNDEIYFTAYSTKLMKIDLSLTHVTEVFDGEKYFTQWFWDENTDELYFSTVNEAEETGSLWVYRNGSAEKLNLPHENIYTFTLTNDKIYYSAYDPVYYGISNVAYYFNRNHDDCRVYDYSGGKVYAADRDNPSAEAVLVYDNEGQYPISNAGIDCYCVFGDYLYFNEITVLREILDGVEYTTFSYADDISKIRVGLKDGSVMKVKFE